MGAGALRIPCNKPEHCTCEQKYGIIERENYNRPKSENSRRPGTTPEKEKAITEALKYFKMI